MKNFFLIVMLFLVITVSECSDGDLTSKNAIVRVFNKNEEIITEAVQTGDFQRVEKIRGIQHVNVWDGYIEFSCGGEGLVPSSSYYGFYYSADNNFMALNGGTIPKNEVNPDKNGFRWKEETGDNTIYYEQIGEHFFYYEMHF